MCATVPQPPEATTGTRTASETARVSGTSKPSFVPSRSMLVSRISPAPRSAPSRAQATASFPVGVRPPWTKTSQPPWPVPRASIARTTACEPKRRATSSSRPGAPTAAVLTATLSAPARRSASASSTVRTPPPTVNGR